MDVRAEIGGRGVTLKYTVNSMCAVEDMAGGALDGVMERQFTAARLLLAESLPPTMSWPGQRAFITSSIPMLWAERGALRLGPFSAGSGSNAMMRDPEHAARFFEEFSDRIMYGCDICTVTNTHQYKLDELLTRLRSDGSISEETYYKVVRGNAAKLLGIE